MFPLRWMMKRRQQPSEGFIHAAKTTGVFDGRRTGPIRSGSINNIHPAMWIFADHIEYVVAFSGPRRLDRADVAEVDVRTRRLFGGEVVFRRSGNKTTVECAFRTRERLQDTLSALAASKFPLSDRALTTLHK